MNKIKLLCCAALAYCSVSSAQSITKILRSDSLYLTIGIQADGISIEKTATLNTLSEAHLYVANYYKPLVSKGTYVSDQNILIGLLVNPNVKRDAVVFHFEKVTTEGAVSFENSYDSLLMGRTTPIDHYTNLFNFQIGGTFTQNSNDTLPPIHIPRRSDPLIFFDIEVEGSRVFLSVINEEKILSIWEYSPDSAIYIPSGLGLPDFDQLYWNLLERAPIETLSDFMFKKAGSGFVCSFANGYCFKLQNNEKSDERYLPAGEKILFMPEHNQCTIKSINALGCQIGSTQYTWQ